MDLSVDTKVILNMGILGCLAEVCTLEVFSGYWMRFSCIVFWSVLAGVFIGIGRM